MNYKEFSKKYPVNILEALNIPIKCKWLCKHEIHNFEFKSKYVGHWITNISILEARYTYGLQGKYEAYMKCRVCGKEIKID